MESDAGGYRSAKQDCASSFRTVSSLSSGLENGSSKHVDKASKGLQGRNTATEGQDWEVTKIVGKRRAGKGFEYKVKWKDTWLPKSEPRKARRLLLEFEARGRLQRDRDLYGLVCTVKG